MTPGSRPSIALNEHRENQAVAEQAAMNNASRIYIAGHRGLVGSALERRLHQAGYENLILRNHQELDLTRQRDVETFFEEQRPEYVLLAAAKVGGIWANTTYPAEFIHQNLAIQTNVIHASYRVNVKRLVFLGSSCIYPKHCPQPIREEHLLSGYLEPTNEPYAIAKIAGIEMCRSYNRQYGTRFISVMPTNLYGPNDNFDLENSHVLPALIRKTHLANLAADHDWEGIERDERLYGRIPEDFKEGLKEDVPKVRLWGSGSPKREFLHVDDLADACVFLIGLEEPTFSKIATSPMPWMNIGFGEDLTIRELASLVMETLDCSVEIQWDSSKPDGTPRKLLDSSRLQGMGWTPAITMRQGIQQVYAQYVGESKLA